jgi:hypothetical protein
MEHFPEIRTLFICNTLPTTSTFTKANQLKKHQKKHMKLSLTNKLILANSSLALSLILTISACNKNKNIVLEKPYGSNTLSCKINGEPFQTQGAYKKNPVGCENFVTSFVGLSGFKFYGKLCTQKYNYIGLTLHNTPSIGSFQIGGLNMAASCMVNLSAPTTAYTSNTKDSGQLIFTHVEQNFIAGTFSFTAKADDNTIITVTEGKFDIAR